MRKRLLPMLLVCCLLAAWLSAYAQADDVVAKGECGVSEGILVDPSQTTAVQWSLDSAGNLSITGKGAMANYYTYVDYSSPSGFATHAPWYQYASMITSITVGKGVTGIGRYAFAGLNHLTKVTFPDSISTIEDGVFRSCSNLLSFAISDNVTSIGKETFRDCDRLTKMLIPHNVVNISESAFKGCDVLQSVTMLADTPIINASTFESCSALREITIPDSVVIIGENAFSGCSALKNVYFTGVENLWKDITINSGNQPLENAKVNYDTSIEAMYRINALSVSDTDGKPLTAIPKSSCLVTVSVTNRASGGSPVVFLASYDAKGKYQGMMYVTVKEPVGGTVEVTLPVDNSAGNIAQFKAFAVKSLSGLEPIGNPVSFPA